MAKGKVYIYLVVACFGLSVYHLAYDVFFGKSYRQQLTRRDDERLLIRIDSGKSLERPRERPLRKSERDAIFQAQLQAIVTRNATTSSEATTSIAEREQPALALLYPPGFMGGYRNQVIRFFGFVFKAQEQMIRQLVYPSILWTTTTPQGRYRPVPMEDIFDIDYWNSFSEHLPRLVGDIGDGDCWSSSITPAAQRTLDDDDNRLLQSVLGKPRFLTPIANTSRAYATETLQINPRKTDLMSEVQHCQHPWVFGGGGGKGNLWVNYMNYIRKRQKDPKTGLPIPDPFEGWFLTALKPLPKWIQLAEQCLQRGTQQQQQQQQQHTTVGSGPLRYIALHPRIELEMMSHNCGAYMNRNLTSIFQGVQQLLENQTDLSNVAGIFVALSREGASGSGKNTGKYEADIRDNVATLNQVIGTNDAPGQGLAISTNPESTHQRRIQLPVFECGDAMIQEYYRSHPDSANYGSLLPSVINFHIAVESTAFVGFRFSSWSNAVWTTRYYLGRGGSNFEYTREHGVRPVENNGLPPPHQNCDAIQDLGR